MEEPRFLPPEPPGPEPEITGPPAKEPPPPPPPPAQPPPETYGDPPYAPSQESYGYTRAPPRAAGQPEPAYQQPPPGYGQPQPWGQAQQPVPDNGVAVAGFVLSIVSLGLLVISFGLSTIVSLGLAIGGMLCSRQGKRKVEAGETPKHGGIAQAGFVIGWVGIGLSLLAIVAWILVIALSAGEDESIFDPDTTRAMREAVGT